MASTILTDADFADEPQAVLSDADFADSSSYLTDADFAPAEVSSAVQPIQSALLDVGRRLTGDPMATALAAGRALPHIRADEAADARMRVPEPVTIPGKVVKYVTEQFETDQPSLGQVARRIPAALAEGAATAASGLLYGAEKIKPGLAGPLSTARQFMQDVGERAAGDYGVDPAQDKAIVSDVIKAVGTMAPLFASGGTLAPATGAAIMGESQRREAEEAGAGAEEQQLAFAAGGSLGLVSEALLGVPSLIRSARASGATGNELRQIANSAVAQGLKGAGREAGQEEIENIGGNLIASTLVGYDPKREALEGSGKAGVIGAVAGAGVGAAVQAAANRTAPLAPVLSATAAVAPATAAAVAPTIARTQPVVAPDPDSLTPFTDAVVMSQPVSGRLGPPIPAEPGTQMPGFMRTTAPAPTTESAPIGSESVVPPDVSTPDTPAPEASTKPAKVDPSGESLPIQSANVASAAGSQEVPSATPATAPEAAAGAAPRVQLRTGPQTFSVVEQLPPQKGDQPGEIYFRVRNERTGATQVVEAKDMKPVRAKGAKAAKPTDAAAMRKKLRGNESGAIDASLFADIADFGAKIYRDGMSFARWSKEMVRHLGSRVRSALKELWVGMISPKGARNLSGEIVQSRDEGAAIGMAGGRVPKPGEPVEDGREGEYYTRTAQRDRGTLGADAWRTVRQTTTIPDEFRADMDTAEAFLSGSGTLADALRNAQAKVGSFDNFTDRVRLAALFLIQQKAAQQKRDATDPVAREMYRDIEINAAASMAETGTGLGKNLNMLGQLYAYMPMSADSMVMRDEELLARFTGGRAAKAEAEQATTKIRKATGDAAEGALDDAKKTGDKVNDSINKKAAASILDKYSKVPSDTQAWNKKEAENPVRKAFREQVENPKSKGEFAAILEGLDVDSRTAELLHSVADRETRSRKAVKMAKDSLKLTPEEQSALRIIERQAKQDSDTLGWNKAAEDPVFLLFNNEARIGRRTKEEFMAAAQALGVSERRAEQLYDAALRENKNIETLRTQAGKNDALDSLISTVLNETGTSLRDILKNKPRATWAEITDKLTEIVQTAIPDISTARAEEVAGRIRSRFEKRIEGVKASLLKGLVKGLPKERKKARTLQEKLFKYFELGALTDETTTRLFMERAGVHEFTPEFRDRLQAMYEKAEAAPEGQPRKRILGQIAVELAMANPKTFKFWWDFAMSISYANILGAFTTVFVNNPLGSLGGSVEMMAQSAATSKGARIETAKGMFKTWARSLREGGDMLWDLLSTGENIQNVSQFDSLLASSSMELMNKMASDRDYLASLEPWQRQMLKKSKVLLAINTIILRANMAADALIRWPAREALRFAESASVAQERRRPGQSLADAVDELNYPGGRVQAVKDAREQASQERKDGTISTSMDERLRVVELIQQKLSAEGAGAAAGADELATRAGLLSEPSNDLLGQVFDKVRGLAYPEYGTEGGAKEVAAAIQAGALQPNLRFLRTSENMIRLLADYAIGYGAARYAFRELPKVGANASGGVALFGGKEGDSEGLKRAGERLARIRVNRFYTGLAIYSTLAAWLLTIDDEEEQWFDIYGTGPLSADERSRLRSSGWKPQSIKLGDTFVPYNVGPLSPLSGLFSPFGRMRDNTRWPKGDAVDQYGTRGPESHAVAAAFGLLESVTNQSFIRPAADFLNVVQGKPTSFGDTPAEYIAKQGSNFVPMNLRAFAQLDEIVNGRKDKAEGFFQTAANGIPFYAPNGRAVTVLGDEVTSLKPMPLRSAERVLQFSELADDTALNFAVENGISIPERARKADGKLQSYREYSDHLRVSGKKMRAWLEGGGMDAVRAQPLTGVNRNGKPTQPRREYMNRKWSDIRRHELAKEQD